MGIRRCVLVEEPRQWLKDALALGPRPAEVSQEAPDRCGEEEEVSAACSAASTSDPSATAGRDPRKQRRSSGSGTAHSCPLIGGPWVPMAPRLSTAPRPRRSRCCCPMGPAQRWTARSWRPWPAGWPGPAGVWCGLSSPPWLGCGRRGDAGGLTGFQCCYADAGPDPAGGARAKWGTGPRPLITVTASCSNS